VVRDKERRGGVARYTETRGGLARYTETRGGLARYRETRGAGQVQKMAKKTEASRRLSGNTRVCTWQAR